MIGLLLAWSAGEAHAITWNSDTDNFEWAEDIDSHGPPSVAAPVVVKSTHFLELRDAVDYAMDAANCNVVNAWENVSTADREGIGVPSTPIKAAHINAVRQAVRNLHTAKGQGIPPAINNTVSEGDEIMPNDVENLRNALDNLVKNSCTTVPTVCGNGGGPEPGEQCDDGAANGDCPATCSATCTTNSTCPFCGDNICAPAEGEDLNTCPADCCIYAVAVDTLAKGGVGGCHKDDFTNYCYDSRNPISAARACKDAGYEYMVAYYPNFHWGWDCSGCRWEGWDYPASASYTFSTPLSSINGWSANHWNSCSTCGHIEWAYCSNISPATVTHKRCGDGVCDTCAGETPTCADCPAVCGDLICSPAEWCWNPDRCLNGQKF